MVLATASSFSASFLYFLPHFTTMLDRTDFGYIFLGDVFLFTSIVNASEMILNRK